MKALIFSAALVLGSLLPRPVLAETSVTIYSKATPGAVNPDLYRPTPDNAGYPAAALPGFAMVREGRRIDVAAGRSSIAIDDVAALIDPTTVRFESLTDPGGTRVIEQDFRFDLVGTSKLLQRYLGQTISVNQALGDGLRNVSGTLLSTEGGLVLQAADGSVDVLTDWQSLSLSELPGGLMTRPTLIWDVSARRSGAHDVRISYETAGVTWWADYNLVWNPGRDENRGNVSVAAWVSIINRSGMDFDQARLKLIAGDVQRATPAMQQQARMLMRSSPMVDEAAGFEEKSFFEFHLYTLGRSTTIPNNATKQLELFPQAKDVPATKKLIYNGLPGAANVGYGIDNREYGAQSNPRVDVFLEFANRRDAGLGIPLPAGRMRVSQLDDEDDTLEFIGEDVIGHTPRNEEIRIRLGSSFDVIGERAQVDYAVDTRARWLEETVEITLTNRKAVAQDVTIAEPMFRYLNWTISGQSEKYKKVNARLIHFDVTVPADGKKTVAYKVRYTW